MSKLLKKQLSHSFNVFGPKFENWLSRMFPIYLGAAASKLSRDFRIICLDDVQRQVLRRLIGMWVTMNEPKPAVD